MYVSHITSKIAYHNEWAAGPPSSTTDTTVVVFPRLAGSDGVEHSKFSSSKSELFENVDCHAVPSAYAIRRDRGL